MNQPNRLAESIGQARAGQSSYGDDDWRRHMSALLRAKGRDGRILDVSRPPGGASAASAIVAVEHLEGGNPIVQKYVVRLKPDSSIYANFDPVEQFTVQNYLHGAGLPVPAALWLDATGEFLGRAGYVMAFASGKSSTPSYFTDGPLSHIDTGKRFRMLRNMIGTLADFHQKTDPWAVPSLAGKGRGKTWLERDINMWIDQVRFARPELAPPYEAIANWLIETAPDGFAPVLLHGDYQASNVLWTGEEISAILDFESVRIGPRESDLAYQFCLDELSARFFSGLAIELPALPQRADWYAQACGVKMTNLGFHLSRAWFQLAAGAVTLARGMDRDLLAEPAPLMDYINRQLLASLPGSLPFEPGLPVEKEK